MNFHELLDSTFCLHLTLTLAHFVWQGLVIAVAAVLAARCLRRAPAQGRYLIHVAALLLMAACLPVTFAVVRGMASEPVLSAPADVIESPVGLAAPPASPVAPPSGVPGSSPTLHSTEDESPAPEAESVVAVEWRELTPYAAGAYFAGVVVMLIRLWFALQGGRRLRRRSQPVDDPGLLQIVRQQAQLLGLRFVPVVAYCERVAVPVVVGVLRPMILLPLSLSTGLTPDQLRAILTHELTHLRRYDHLVNVLQRFVEAVLFFHPAVWYVGWRINIERENCCDDLVVATGEHRCTYAESLVRVAELNLSARTSDRPRASAALGATDGSRSQLGQRILRLIDGRSHEKLRLRRSWPVAFVLIATVLVATSMFVNLRAEPAGEHEAAETATEALNGIPAAKATTRPTTQPAAKGAGKAVFQTLTVAMTSTWLWNRTITVHGDGTYVFDLQPLKQVPGKRHMQPDDKHYIARYRLQAHHLRRLEELLAATKWLARPGKYNRRMYDGTKFALAVVRGGRKTTTICQGDQDQAYKDLVRFLRRINRQEWLLYQMTQYRSNPISQLDDELDALLDKSGSKITPYAPVLDYERLLPTLQSLPAGVKVHQAGQDKEVIEKIRRLASRDARKKPTTQPGKSTLAFRIVPNAIGSSRQPVRPLFVGRTREKFAARAIADLATRGPESVAKGDGGLKLRWFELACEAPKGSLVGTCKGKRYVLLCDDSPYVMVMGQGKEAWGIESVSRAVGGGGGPSILIKFDQRGALRLKQITGANKGNMMAIVVEGKVVSAPVIQSTISTYAMITGKFTDAEVTRLIRALGAVGPADRLTKALDLTPQQEAKVRAWFAARRDKNVLSPGALAKFLRTILDEKQRAVFNRLIESPDFPVDESVKPEAIVNPKTWTA